MAVQVKEREYWTLEMFDYLEKSKKACEETFLPYRRLFNATPWLQLRMTMPDVVNRMFSAVLENRLLGAAVAKEYGGWGLNCLQDGLVAAEKVKLARTALWDFISWSGNYGVPCLKWAKS